MTVQEINSLLGQIDARQSHYQELRAVAAGAIRQGWDKTGRFILAGSIASDIVAVLEASLIGRVDLRVEPQDDLADALVTALYNKQLHKLAQESVRDYIVCGWGGVVVTPWGPRRLKPESSTFIGSDGYVRRFSIDATDARRRFGQRKALDAKRGEVVLVEALSDGYLEVWFGSDRLYRQKWDYRPHLLLGDERPSLVDDGLYGAPISVVESCAPLFDRYDLIGLAIARKSLRAGVVQVVVSQLEDPESAEAISSRWDCVIVRDGPAVMPLEELSLQELLAVRASIEQEIASRTGVTPYARGLSDPRTQTATEVALIQSQGGTRLAYQQAEVRDWLNSIVGDFRRWLVWLPPEEQEAVEIPYNNTIEVFGAGRPYSDVLAGKLVTVAGAGYLDVLQRQQQIQMLLPLAQIGLNSRPLLEELIRLSGRDPKLLMQGDIQQ
jgi:hypothetical protein